MPLRFALRTRWIVGVLAAIAVTLVLLSAVGQFAVHGLGLQRGLRLVRLFYVDEERNFPTFFACLLLLSTAGLAGLIAVWKNRRGEPGRYHWAALAAGFAYMAVDEFAGLHELLNNPVRTLLGPGELGIFYYAWVLPAIAAVGVLALVFLRFWLRLPAPTRSLTLVSAVLYVGGCIGVELLGGYYAELHGRDNLTYTFIATLEESLEMAGIITFIGTLLHHLGQSTPRVEVHMGASSAETRSLPT